MNTLHIIISLFLPTLFLLSCSKPVVLSFSPSEPTIQSQCLDDQRSALVQLQQGLYFSHNFTFSSKSELWELNADCCFWKGVKCDALGHVIGLDLSHKNLSGSFHSIFNLYHLQHLNLAGNNFNSTLFPYGFERLPNLTHLNLSNSCFHGQIPIEISYLTRLVSLDLSNQDDCHRRNYQSTDGSYGDFLSSLKLEKPNFKTLINNLRSLRELYLDSVNISTQSTKWCDTISSALPNLRVLSLSYCGLTGPFCSSFSTLYYLSKLNLDGNPISYLPPNFLEISSRLVSLSLVNCNLNGHFPPEIFSLPNLRRIDISENYNLMGQLLEFPINNTLQVLSLSYTMFEGNLPESIGNLKFLTNLELADCYFSRSIPSSIANLTNLVELDLEWNYFNGLIPPFHRSRVPNLARLNLNGNRLSGSIHSSLFTLPSLHSLSLGGNQLVGKIDEFPNASSSLIEYLSLDDNHLRGPIPKSIFQLPWLESFSIGYNNFGSLKFDMFFQLKKLRSLDLSNLSLSSKSDNKSLCFPQLEELILRSCNLTEFPEFIKTQDKLVSLDLSNNQIHGFLPNWFWLWKTTLSSLDLSFNAIDFPKQIPFGDANLSFSIESDNKSFTFPQLKYLTLSSCNLTEFPEFIKTQDKLVSLDLSNNQIHGFLPNWFWLWNTTLSRLDLSSNAIDFPKQIPFGDANSFSIESDNKSFTLPQLEDLHLRSCNLTEFPEFIKTQDKLITLDLSNNQIHGVVPNWLWKTTLLDLRLSSNAIDFPKQFPFGDANSSFSIESDNKSFTLPQLEDLNLRSCNLTEFPEFIKTQDKLVSLDLSNNQIHGFVPNWLWKTTLSGLDLSFNAIDFPKQFPFGDANSSFPMLNFLWLSSCNISTFPEFLKSQENLESLDLSNNKISGAVPNWLWKKSLRSLYLSDNHLSSLDQFLPNQSLASSQGSLPRPICNLSQLDSFDASYNNLSGPIPNCLGNISTLFLLDLQGNNFSGILPNFAKAAQLWTLKVGENRLEGKLPRSLAECTQLEVLDVGNNMIYDTFPFWLQKLPTLKVLILRENRFYGQIKHLKLKNVFSSLDVLDIASNEFSGELSIDFLQATQLRSLKIGGNKLEGKLPRSLANCTKLEVLDLGNNMVHDTFPFWLEKLPSLKVLILRANRFYGTLENFETEDVFQMLRILDIASNNFSGDLSIEFLQCLRAMTSKTDGKKAKLDYIGEQYYQDSVTIVNKGIVIFYKKILNIFACLDLSNNSFHGRIPEEIQNFKSLIVLNLSHNSFFGSIPPALGDLLELESLDLSRNDLSGKIPLQLTSLTFLEALNLSYNQLEGNIPQSNQFGTFLNDSFKGNPRLCGQPLTRNCNEVSLGMPPPKEDVDSLVDGLSDWKIVLIGYGCGLVIGLCTGYTVLNELGNKWFDSFTREKNRKWRRSR